MQRVGQSARETVEACLCRAVDVVGFPNADAGNRGEHDELATTLLSQQVCGMGQDGHLRNVVGVHYRHRVLGVCLCASVVAQNAERQHDGAQFAMGFDDRIEHTPVRRHVVGIEEQRGHLPCPSCRHLRNLIVQFLATPRGKHHFSALCQPNSYLHADIAVPSQNEQGVVYACGSHA